MDRTSLMIGRVRRTNGDARVAVERELALAYRREPARREEIAQALMPLARSVLRRYRHVREPREDLEQVAMIGLLKALAGFDPSRCPSFAAYAYPTVNGELRRHFRDTGWAVHVPRGTKQRAVAIRRLEREAGVRLADEDVARRLEVTEGAVRTARRAGMAMLTEPMPGEHGERGGHLGAVGMEDSGYASVDDHVTARRLVRDLPVDQRTLVELRFAGGLSQRRIGEILGVSQMQVSRRLRHTLDTLRDQHRV